MFKRILISSLIFMLMTGTAFALNLSRVKTWSAEVLTHGDLNAEFDNILNHSIANADISSTAAIVGSKLDLAIPGAIGGTTPAAGAFTTLSASGALSANGNVTLGDAAADTVHFNANTLIDFEGATADGIETILVITDPTSSDKNITIPNANSVTLPAGAVFFMITGSCPAGTTNVSATYSNKFIKINATAGTSASATAATDSHTLSTSEMPSHTHGILGGLGNAIGTTGYEPGAGGGAVSASTGGGGGHTHNLTSLEPSSVTMILCQVD